ncbi:MAG: TonB-dependent receptor [Saprospiraceae bacterium]|nr:TonB-dependent receptor [Saprospiraceae bacterium]
MNIKTLSLFSLLFMAPLLHSQAVVKGTVKDETGSPISFASVSLHAAADSALIQGSLSDDVGAFLLVEITQGKYVLICSFVGKETQVSLPFEIREKDKTATIDFVMQTSQLVLQEAVITAKRPFLEQKADRLVVNVANSAIAAGGTAMEILKKVPGVVILQDRVTLGGSQNLQVWVDGKPSPYTDMNALLREMPGDQIEKIEVISRPGAQFDAAGGPILNVVLKRNADLGFKGTAALTLSGYRVDQRDVDGGIKNYGRINPSLNLNYRSGKINLFGNSSYNKGRYYSVIKIDRFIGDDLYIGHNLDNTEYEFKNLRFGADYYAGQKTTLGATMRLWSRKGAGDGFNATTVFAGPGGPQIDAFDTDNITDSKRSGLYSNVNAKHEFNKKTGQQLTLDLDFNQFTSRNINDLAIYAPETPLQRSLSRQDVDQPAKIYVVKTDYTHAIDSTLKLDAGLKFSFANIHNDLNFYRNEVLSALESNDFLYKENINAAYINLSKSLPSLELNAGLRTEQTRVNGFSMNEEVLTRNYWQLFPSASALYKFTKELGLQASFSRRINRPGFQQQNPFSYFIDSLTYSRGNPRLKPEITNTMQLNLTYDNQPVFGINYTITDDVIVENAPQLEGTKTFTTSENLAVQRRLEIQLNFPVKIGKYIDGFAGNQAIYNAYDANYLETRYKQSRWHWLAYWGINVQLPAETKLEIGGFYMTKFLEEFLLVNKLAALNLGLSKTFWDKKARLALSYNDVLYSEITNAIIDFKDVKVNFYQREFSRQLRLSFSYQFGNTQMKNPASKRAASENETSRVKIE